MASGENSNQTSGSQQNLEQEEAALQAARNEALAEQQYLEQILPQSSPLHIPKTAAIISQEKKRIQPGKVSMETGRIHLYESLAHKDTRSAC